MIIGGLVTFRTSKYNSLSPVLFGLGFGLLAAIGFWKANYIVAGIWTFATIIALFLALRKNENSPIHC
jgi:hypothetical protein